MLFFSLGLLVVGDVAALSEAAGLVFVDDSAGLVLLVDSAGLFAVEAGAAVALEAGDFTGVPCAVGEAFGVVVAAAVAAGVAAGVEVAPAVAAGVALGRVDALVLEVVVAPVVVVPEVEVTLAPK